MKSSIQCLISPKTLLHYGVKLSYGVVMLSPLWFLAFFSCLQRCEIATETVSYNTFKDLRPNTRYNLPPNASTD